MWRGGRCPAGPGCRASHRASAGRVSALTGFHPYRGADSLRCSLPAATPQNQTAIDSVRGLDHPDRASPPAALRPSSAACINASEGSHAPLTHQAVTSPSPCRGRRRRPTQQAQTPKGAEPLQILDPDTRPPRQSPPRKPSQNPRTGASRPSACRSWSPTWSKQWGRTFLAFRPDIARV